MMDLEIKDYERTIETLTDTINVKDEEITTQQQELSHHTQQIEQLHTQIGMVYDVNILVMPLYCIDMSSAPR